MSQCEYEFALYEGADCPKIVVIEAPVQCTVFTDFTEKLRYYEISPICDAVFCVWYIRNHIQIFD